MKAKERRILWPQKLDMLPAFSRMVTTRLFYLCYFSSLILISLGGLCWADKADAVQIATAVRK